MIKEMRKTLRELQRFGWKGVVLGAVTTLLLFVAYQGCSVTVDVGTASTSGDRSSPGS